MGRKNEFQSRLAAKLPPLLREHSFRGSGSRFHRLEGDTLHVVEVQAGGGGAGVYVNLGVDNARLGLKKTAAKTVRQPSCPFRTRLHDFAGGDFFPYGDDAAEVEMSVLSLTEAMKTEGLSFFGAFDADDLPSMIKRLARKGYAEFPSLDAPAGPSTWAKLAKALGDVASAKAFADQQRAIDEARAEEERRISVIAGLAATSTWHGRAYDCVNEACATLRKAQFAAWERALKKTAPAERMNAIVPYLEEHHPDVVERVAERYTAASGAR